MKSEQAKRKIGARLAAALLVGAVWAVTAVAAQSPVARELDQNPSYLFQVVLLVGDQQGATDLAALPENARKAIEDIRGFLSFKSYRLVDVAVVRSNGEATALVNGPDGEDYAVRFNFDSDPESRRLLVRAFTVAEVAGRAETPGSPPAPAADATTRQPAQAPRAPRRLVAASFSVDVEETIVVGTSKLNGPGTALVVLLTAMP